MMQVVISGPKISKFSKDILIRHLSSHNSDKRPELPGNESLKKDVINLYKNLLFLSRDWPTDLRPRIRNAFAQNRDVENPDEIRKLIARGEYVCREITATYHLSKYRAMKRRYYDEDGQKQLDEMFKNLSEQN